MYSSFSHDFTGKYYYLEASAPRRQGDKTWLVSATFPATSGQCFSFWYNMNGRNIGTLNIYVKYSTGGNTSLWTLSGDHGDKWLNGQAPVVSNVKYQVSVLIISCNYTEFSALKLNFQVTVYFRLPFCIFDIYMLKVSPFYRDASVYDFLPWKIANCIEF